MKILVFLFITVFFANALAQFKQSGSIGIQVQSYQYDLGNQFENEFYQFQISSRADYKSRAFKLKSDFTFQNQTPDTILQIKNLYFEVPQGGFKTRWGYQTLQIDGPDFANPAKVMNAENWTDPTNPLTLASLGVSVSLEYVQWQFDFLYIPQQTSTVLPHQKSPWWPRQKRLLIESEDTELKIPDDIQYEIRKNEMIDDADLNNFVFVMKQKSESIETQLVLYDGLSTNPFILTELTASVISLNPTQILLLESPVILKPIGYRHFVTAGTFLIPFDTWSLKGGLQFSKPKNSDERIPDSTQSATLGIEKNWDTSLGVTTHIFQLTHEPTAEKSQLSFLRSIFAKAVCYGVRIPLNDESDVLAAIIYDTIGKSSVHRSQFNFRMSESTSFSLAGQWLSGPKETLLNIYEDYDSYSAQITYHW